MQIRRPTAVLISLAACLLFLGALGRGGEKAPKRKSLLFPSDLGPETVDVSGYPPRLRKIYREVMPKCMSCHTLARVFNAPLAELSGKEEAKAREEHPGLFDPEILRCGPEAWKIYIKRMFMRPPCCGSCGVWTQGDIRQVHEFLSHDSRVRKTGAKAGEWMALRRKLTREFKAMREKQP